MDATPADALLVVDAQNAFLAGAHAVPGHRRLRQAIGRLIDAARAASAQVVFLQNDGPPGAPDAPQCPGWALAFAPAAGEAVLRKREDDGFDGTGLDAHLAAAGVRTLALCGVLSEMCVAATARTALARGYGVVLPHDAHGTYDVPSGPGGAPSVPAYFAARAAEWSLGDAVRIVPSAVDVRFAARARRRTRLRAPG